MLIKNLLSDSRQITDSVSHLWNGYGNTVQYRRDRCKVHLIYRLGG